MVEPVRTGCCPCPLLCNCRVGNRQEAKQTAYGQRTTKTESSEKKGIAGAAQSAAATTVALAFTDHGCWPLFA